MTLGVVYLARAANPPHFARNFLSSLAHNPAGCAYDLILIRKGYGTAQTPALGDGLVASGLSRVLYHDIDDTSFATNAFLDVARRFDHDYLLYFVSWSRVLAADWATIMLGAFDRVPGCGLVGASSGWERLNDTTPFPNRSIRTTGFLIRRETLLALDPGDLSVKYGGNLFEAGPRSMTRQIEQAGLTPVLAGRDGRYFLGDEWPSSHTFRSGDQENLLFADNRTHQYAIASLSKRIKLARLNWGEAAEPAPASAFRRGARHIAWRCGIGTYS